MHSIANRAFGRILLCSGLLISGHAFAGDPPKLALSFGGDPPHVHAYGDVKRGWTLTVKVGFAFANAESDDKLTAKLSKGKKVECKRRTTATWYVDLKDKSKDVPINVYECKTQDKVKSRGKLSISFDYRSSDEEKTYKKVAKLNFEIKKGKKYFYAAQDNLVGPVFFNYDPRSMRDKYDKKQPKLWMWTRVMVPYTTGTPKEIMARCKLDGKKVFKSSLRADSKISIGDQFSIYEIVIWGRHHIGEGSTLNKEHKGNWPFGDHPGQYECRMSIGGTTYRKWKFTVNKAGMIEDACGPALGMDVAHGIFTSNTSSKDHKHNKKLAAKGLMWLPKVPKVCKGLL